MFAKADAGMGVTEDDDESQADFFQHIATSFEKNFIREEH